MRVLVRLLLILLFCRSATWSRESDLDLASLSLEELMEIEVTSVSKKAEKRTQAAAAVAVVTRDDIRRTGATSIPEALRLVPGVQVARFDASKWAITIRGFNSLFANKLLVLIDGRSKYNTMYSGVFWETLDLPLDEVERIEVIRGPGATLWGANAVNGIVNIITRPAAETQGMRVEVGAGDEERRFATVRYGGELGREGHYRVFAKYFDRDEYVDSAGEGTGDAWEAGRMGFRMDWSPADGQVLCLHGDTYRGDIGELAELPSLTSSSTRMQRLDAGFSGGHLLGRWKRVLSPDAELQVQFYYDRTRRDDAPLLTGFYENYDIDFQHRRLYGRHQEVVCGAGYRLTRDELNGDFFISFQPPSRRHHLFSAFVQDELELVPARLRLTLGSKFEHNSFSGFEVQPNARLLWTPHARHTVWGAISRAVRTPSRGDQDLRFVRQILPAGTLGEDSPPAYVVPMGSRAFAPEELLAGELGYRLRPADPLFADLTAFYQVYDDLRTYEAGLPFFEEEPPPPHLVLPLYQENRMRGSTRGAELAVDWLAFPWCRLRAAYTYLWLQLRLDAGSQYKAAENVEEEAPDHQLVLRSSLDLPARCELDAVLRCIDELPTYEVERYWELDGRLGWRPTRRVEFSVVGQNLLHERHAEYSPVAVPFVTTRVERGLYGAFAWSF